MRFRCALLALACYVPWQLAYAQQTATQAGVHDGSEALAAGTSGVRRAQPGSNSDLDNADPQRYERISDQTGFIAFKERDWVEELTLQMFFPKSGMESVSVGQDATLDSDTVRALGEQAQHTCTVPTVNVGTSLFVCLIPQSSWYNVTWQVPFSQCTKEVGIKLAGTFTCAQSYIVSG
jgi:hypothetical protein